MTRARLQVKEVEQHLTEACRMAKVETFELSLDLGLVPYRVKEVEARAEEARDVAIAVEDKATESVLKVEERVEVLCRELKMVTDN